MCHRLSRSGSSSPSPNPLFASIKCCKWKCSIWCELFFWELIFLERTPFNILCLSPVKPSHQRMLSRDIQSSVKGVHLPRMPIRSQIESNSSRLIFSIIKGGLFISSWGWEKGQCLRPGKNKEQAPRERSKQQTDTAMWMILIFTVLNKQSQARKATYGSQDSINSG